MRSLAFALLVCALFGCPKRAAEPAPPSSAPAPAASEVAAIDAGLARGPGPTEDRLGPLSPCTDDAACAEGLVCEGCGEDDRICVVGCRTDADCQAPESCQTVQCIKCPCPKLCGQ